MRHKCLGVFLVFVTVPLVILSILFLSSANLFKASYYKALLKKSNSYVLYCKTIPQDTPESNRSNIITTIYHNLTPTWLEQNLSKNLDNFFVYLNNRQTNLNLTIDIRPFKAEFLANAPAETQNLLPDDLGPSSYVKFLQDVQNLSTSSGELSQQTNSAALVKQISDSHNFAKQVDQNSSLIKKGYTILKISIWVIFGLSLLMLALIGLASRHWIAAVFRWLGVTLLIAGILTFAASLVVSQIILRFNPVNILKISEEIKQVSAPLYHNLTADFISSLGKNSLMVAIVGLILLIISYILPKFMPEPSGQTPSGDSVGTSLPAAPPKPIKIATES